MTTFKLGTKVICKIGDIEYSGEINGYSCMPYNEIPYEYFIHFPEGSVIGYKGIPSENVRLLEYPSISSASYKGELLLPEKLACPISHVEFVDGQEVIQLLTKFLFDKEELEKFWRFKGVPINPLTNLQVIHQSDILRFKVRKT